MKTERLFPRRNTLKQLGLMSAGLAAANVGLLHASSAPATKTAVRVSRANATVWVGEDAVEGASSGGYERIRLLDRADAQ